MEDYPGMAFGAVGKQLGEEWRNMKSDTKKKFQDIELADKQRYESELEAYNNPTVKAVRTNERSTTSAHPYCISATAMQVRIGVLIVRALLAWCGLVPSLLADCLPATAWRAGRVGARRGRDCRGRCRGTSSKRRGQGRRQEETAP